MNLDIQQIFRDFVVELQKQAEIRKAKGIDIVICGDTPWTEIVQEAFYEIGKLKKGIKVYASSHGGEYLLDVLWDSIVDKEHGAVLGLESEWGNIEDVEEDFYKLMYVKSRFKVLIYSSASESNRLDLQQMIKNGLVNFNKHLEGERYLFIDINNFEPYRIIAIGFTVTQAVLKDREVIALQNIGSAEWDEVAKNYIL